jgi:hypothetical protein
LQGADVVIRSLDLDGALIVRCVRGKKVVIDGLVVKNRGWEMVPYAVDGEHAGASCLGFGAAEKMRGFALVKYEEKVVVSSAW